MTITYLGMLFPMIAFLLITSLAIYGFIKTVLRTRTIFNNNHQSIRERRKLPDRRLQAAAT